MEMSLGAKMKTLVMWLIVWSVAVCADEGQGMLHDTYAVDLETVYVNMTRSIDNGATDVESKVDDILHLKMTLTLFPKTYNITLGYAKNITENVDNDLYNPNGYDSDVSHIYVAATPWYHESYGGLGLFYTSSDQNSRFVNKTDHDIGPYKYKGKTLTWAAPAIPSGESYQTKEKASYLGVKYLIPQLSWLPKGANVYYSTMDRSTVYYAATTWNGTKTDRILHLSDTGALYGFGLQRSLHELPREHLSLDLVQISKGAFGSFPKIELSEYTAGATYRGRGWYLKGVMLLYVAEEYANGGLYVPRQSDYMTSIHLGMSF